MKPQKLTIITLYTKDALGIQQIILNSLDLFLKKEFLNIANLSCHIV